jgi:hypothetical protein
LLAKVSGSVGGNICKGYQKLAISGLAKVKISRLAVSELTKKIYGFADAD